MARPKDAEADRFIRSLIAQQPSAPYLLVQTVLVQEHALQNAQARIAELERQCATQNPAPPQGGSFLSGLLHKTPPTPQPAATVPAPTPVQSAAPQPPPLPYPSTVNIAPSAGGGFLRSALATAAGVAGGSLLFQGIENLIGHHSGPFGPTLGSYAGGGFLDQPVTENVEVINNYYDENPRRSDDPGLQQADYDPGQTDQTPDDLGLDDSASSDLSSDAYDDSGSGDSLV